MNEVTAADGKRQDNYSDHSEPSHDRTAGDGAAERLARSALGEMTGAVYTNDLLDRIFSRFCIGK